MRDPPEYVSERFSDEVDDLDDDEILELINYLHHMIDRSQKSLDQTPSTEYENKDDTTWSIEPWKKYFKARKQHQDII